MLDFGSNIHPSKRNPITFLKAKQPYGERDRSVPDFPPIRPVPAPAPTTFTMLPKDRHGPIRTSPKHRSPQHTPDPAARGRPPLPAQNTPRSGNSKGPRRRGPATFERPPCPP